MKKLAVLVAILAVVGGAQADNMVWLGLTDSDWANPANGTNNWMALDNDLNPLPAHLPTAADAVFIDNDLTSIGAAGLPLVAPTVSSTATAAALGMAWFDTASTLNIVNGGSLSVGGGGFMRVGNAIGSTATINMTGGILNSADILQIGYNGVINSGTPTNYLESSGSGVINMSGDATINAASVLFAQDSIYFGDSGTNGTANGTGVINMDGSSLFVVDGDQTGTDWIADGWITAVGAGDSIVSSYDGSTATTFSVIPEPATFGLMALLGGGMLWIRKRFTS